MLPNGTGGGCALLSDRIGDLIPAYSGYDTVAGTLDTIHADFSLPQACGGGPEVCR